MINNKGKSIAVTSSKGGVGKTILTLNLAAIYQQLNKKVLIIDNDLFGGAIALNLNLDITKTIYNLIDDLSNNRFKKIENYITKYSEFIDIISSPKDPRQANKIDMKYMENILELTRHAYDVILIDTTNGLDRNNVIVLDIVDTILYVMNNDPMDIKNTKSFMSIIKDTGLDNVKVVLNNARDLNLNYFSNFDIKNVIKKNIDYTISGSLHIKNITKYILDEQILILNKKLGLTDKKDYKKLINMAKNLLED